MGFFDDFTKGIKDSLRGDIDELLKADADAIKDNPEPMAENKGSIGQKAIIDDPYFDQVHQHFIFKSKMSRISNKTLKDTSLRDWLISSIMQARVDTMLRFARPQRKQFDMGFKIFKKESNDNLTAEEKEEIANLEDFIYNCGRKEKTPPGEEMLLGEFLKLTTRDALTFGHVAIEKILTRSGGLHRFRPLPAESMYLINQQTSHAIIAKEIENAKTMRNNHANYDTENDPNSEREINEPDIDYYKYVQMSYDNRVMSAFGDEDMIWKLFNPQNFTDSMGYCYSTLELAVINVTNHLNVENYNANFFTHGYAAKGILHLKGTVTTAQLTAFRRQFYNTISGAQNAWRTPIISGLDDVQFVTLAGNAKEMEYLNYNSHIMRAVCSQFQIDPIELGLDYLTSPTGSSPGQQANNEYKITYSRERGLYPILMCFEDLINASVLPALDKDLAAKYEFKFVGYTDETPQTNVALLQAEMTVHSSMNDLLHQAGKESVKHPVYDLPLNETFWNLVEKNMTKAEIRRDFFGDKDAIDKRELAYIPADPAFMGWQQLLMTMDRSRRQDEQEAQQIQAEQEAQQQQSSREQEAHDMEMEENKSRHANAAVNHQSLKEHAKESGAASSAIHVEGETIANPINSDEADR